MNGAAPSGGWGKAGMSVWRDEIVGHEAAGEGMKLELNIQHEAETMLLERSVVRFAQACSVVVIILGSWCIGCWLANRPQFTTLASTYWPVAPRGALVVLLLGASLFLHLTAPARRAIQSCVTVCVSLVFVLCLWSLVEEFVPFKLGLETRAFQPPPGFDAGKVLNIPAGEVVHMMLTGIVLIGLVRAPQGRLAKWAGPFAFATGLVGLGLVIGYLFQVRLIVAGNLRPVGFLAAVALVWFSLGLGAASDPQWIARRLLGSPTASTRLLKKVLQIAFLVFVVAALARDFILWQTLPVLALHALWGVALVTWLMFHVFRTMGRDLEQAEAARREAETALKAARDELELLVRERTAELSELNEKLRSEIPHRKEMEAALRESVANFSALGDTVPVIIFVQQGGKCCYANATAESLFGYAPGQMLGCNVWDLIHPDYRELARERAQRREAGEEVAARFEVPVLTKGGQVRWVDASVREVQYCGRPGVLVCALDITGRRQAESELRWSEERFRTLFESAPIGVALHDAEGRYLQVNRAYCEMLGYSEAELRRLGIRRVTHPDDVSEGRQFLGDLRTGKRDHYSREKRYQAKDGRTVHALAAASAVRHPDGQVRYIVSMVQDVTERKRLQQEILEISAQEQRRLGQDLHDGLGQYLSGIAFKAKCLEESLRGESPAHAAHAQELVRLVNNAIGQTRGLARGLDPVEIEIGGLVQALENLACESEKLFAVNCRFCHDLPSVSLDTATALHLFRIAQEAINNAAKHGQAQQIDLELSARGEKLRLAVRDDGNGFPPDQVAGNGMGLRIMRHRADSIGAILRVQPNPGRGTEVECVLPKARLHAQGARRAG